MTRRLLLGDRSDRAWGIIGAINFDGHGAVPLIHDYYNVTSITDNAAGDFTITWDQDFVAASSYCVAGSCGGSAALGIGFVALHNTSTPMTAQSARIKVTDFNGGDLDTLVTLFAVGKL